MLLDTFTAMVLGIVEGLTEFIPVSSTGHLLLVEHFFGFDDETFGKSFAVLIQLGAILALISIYFVRLWKIALALPRDPDARRFTLGVLIAFLPAAVIGALAYRIIKDVLFNVWVVCISLIVAVGFITSFIAGWFVVKTLLDYVSSHGFSLFVWWRVGVGALGLIALGVFR